MVVRETQNFGGIFYMSLIYRADYGLLFYDIPFPVVNGKSYGYSSFSSPFLLEPFLRIPAIAFEDKDVCWGEGNIFIPLQDLPCGFLCRCHMLLKSGICPRSDGICPKNFIYNAKCFLFLPV